MAGYTHKSMLKENKIIKKIKSFSTLFFKKKYTELELPSEVQTILDTSVKIAKSKGHEFAYVEHIILALLHDDNFLRIIDDSSGDIVYIKKEINTQLNMLFEKRGTQNFDTVQATKEFELIIKNTINQALSSEQEISTITGVYLLASILSFKDSFSYKLLENIGITRIKILEFLSHNILKNLDSEEDQFDHKFNDHDLVQILMHNDNFTTMKYVIEILTTVFDKTEEQATQIMLEIHKNKVGLCGDFTYNQAIEKINKVHQMSHLQGFPLKCSIKKV